MYCHDREQVKFIVLDLCWQENAVMSRIVDRFMRPFQGCMLTDLSPSITGLSNASMRLTPAFKD